MKTGAITTMFLDIGGVLLSNGWGKAQRKNAIAHFRLDAEELNERHHLTFDTYEEGKLSLSDYLKRIVFYVPRNFTEKEFIDFMFQQSLPFQENIEFFKQVKIKNNLKVIAVSNEGRELNNYRVNEYKLTELFDAFVSSSFIHLRKPDKDMFQMAIDMSQTKVEEAIYIDDRLMFVEVAQSLGLKGIHHISLEETTKHLHAIGIKVT